MKRHFVRIATYNKWAYQTLFEKVNLLSPSQYAQPEPLFSHSVHGTLCHLLLAEMLWYGRMNGQSVEEWSQRDFPHLKSPFAVNDLWKHGPSNGGQHWAMVEPIDQPRVLQTKILDQCDRWITFINGLSEEELEGNFLYRDTKNNEQSRMRSDTLDHVFNHSTHHRGQISTLVMKHLGAHEAPEMDLLYCTAF